MEGIRVSLGGFLSRQIVKQNFDTNGRSYEYSEYNDGYASTDAWTNAGVSMGGATVSSGTITTAAKPGAIAGSAQAWSRAYANLGNGMAVGNGAGVWDETIIRIDDTTTETVTLTYSVPVGIEIPLSKKWTFRAGTEYQLVKTETTTEVTTGVQTTDTTATPANGAKVYNHAVAQGTYTESVIKAENHTVFYTYGVQFDATPALTIACNAFLDTNAGAGNTFFDLDTYRLLSLSASLKF